MSVLYLINFVSNCIKFKKNEPAENYPVCEFSTHCSCRNEEMKLKSTMTN